MGRIRNWLVCRANATRRRFSSRSSLILAITAIVALAIGGGVYVRQNVLSVQAELPQLQLGRLRDGVVAIADLHRVSIALNEARDNAGRDSAMIEALDFLYVRAEVLAAALADRRGDDDRAADGEKLLRLITRTVELGDAWLAAAPDEREAASQALLDQLRVANAALIRFVNVQQHAQSAAIAEQSQALFDMSLSTGGLLLVFVVISSVALALLRAEIKSRIQRREAEQQARFLAYFDQMTGLPNRVQFTETLRERLESAGDGQDGAVLALIDLDGFKGVNDTHGHAMGDAFLQSVADRIASSVRPFDGFAARLGGDEFAIIANLPRDAAERAAFAQRVLDAIRAPLAIEGVALAPRASLGMACVEACNNSGDDGVDVDVDEEVSALMKRADLALYEAKARGKDCHAIFDAAMDARIERRRVFERDLAEALGRDEMFQLYQPQVMLADGAVYGFEALARWQRPDGVAAPGEFIAIAERTGLIVDIDLWGLDRALSQAAAWRRGGGSVSPSISVNLSALHFRSDAIVSSVAFALEKHDVPPEALTLELTETLLIEDWPTISKVLNALHRLGVKIALDDFGSGFSSLNYLRHLHADMIKIDRSFLRDLESSRDARAILSALVDLTRSLDMELLVEGVETVDQQRLLLELGCTRAQGYLFGRPLSVADASAMLDQARCAA